VQLQIGLLEVSVVARPSRAANEPSPAVSFREQLNLFPTAIALSPRKRDTSIEELPQLRLSEFKSKAR